MTIVRVSINQEEYFNLVSYSDVPKLKMYFGARHGKGPADGAVGRVKAAAARAVKS